LENEGPVDIDAFTNGRHRQMQNPDHRAFEPPSSRYSHLRIEHGSLLQNVANAVRNGPTRIALPIFGLRPSINAVQKTPRRQYFGDSRSRNSLIGADFQGLTRTRSVALQSVQFGGDSLTRRI
jgi:hypothetical protein